MPPPSGGGNPFWGYLVFATLMARQLAAANGELPHSSFLIPRPAYRARPAPGNARAAPRCQQDSRWSVALSPR
ncbi:hypothetical protein FAGKG844_280026 [Frankia sp. AgKG'84/4]